MTLLCRLFGHKWRMLLKEQCSADYHVCIRCNAVRHGCNDVDWRTRVGGRVPHIGHGLLMRRVIMESPYAGDVEGNLRYARAALRDCLERGEAPIASHLLYAQPGVLDDAVPVERDWGITAGLAWAEVAEAAVFYVDRGWSSGMKAALAHHKIEGVPCEFRQIPDMGETSAPEQRYVTCFCGADVDTDSRSERDVCGRLVE